MLNIYSGDTTPYVPNKEAKICKGNTPDCLDKFIATRKGQRQCIKCLIYKGKLHLYPPL